MSESRGLKRPHFFSGKLLASADLELEQQYVREKLKRHNRSLHGFGIVSGLKVTINSGQIVVEPGLALDCEGNELAIEVSQTIVSQPGDDWRAAFGNVRCVEESAGQTTASGTAEVSPLARILIESFELVVAQENCNRRHRHLRARWLACGLPHALTIAKLLHGSQGWRVDRAYRPPHLK